LQTDLDPSNEIFFVANTILFVVYLIPAVYVLYKFKLGLDRSALANIAIYILSFLTRAIMWGLAAFNEQPNTNKSIFRGIMINLEYVAAFVLEISMYFFVFEMMTVQSILLSNSYQQNKKR
jgi:hypothetical protein